MPPYEVEQRMDELQQVSDDWLTSKAVVERQFSIGFFDRDYLATCSCAVVELIDTGKVQAFANLLKGPGRQEMSVDLMRYRSEGPKVMDFLFASLFFYAREQGYERFNLGMAPLASVGESRGAHARERVARILFQHGEHWYNFQGLRQVQTEVRAGMAAPLHGIPEHLGVSRRHRLCGRAGRRRLDTRPDPVRRAGRQVGFRIHARPASTC